MWMVGPGADICPWMIVPEWIYSVVVCVFLRGACSCSAEWQLLCHEMEFWDCCVRSVRLVEHYFTVDIILYILYI